MQKEYSQHGDSWQTAGAEKNYKTFRVSSRGASTLTSDINNLERLHMQPTGRRKCHAPLRTGVNKWIRNLFLPLIAPDMWPRRPSVSVWSEGGTPGASEDTRWQQYTVNSFRLPRGEQRHPNTSCCLAAARHGGRGASRAPEGGDRNRSITIFSPRDHLTPAT